MIQKEWRKRLLNGLYVMFPVSRLFCPIRFNFIVYSRKVGLYVSFSICFISVRVRSHCIYLREEGIWKGTALSGDWLLVV